MVQKRTNIPTRLPLRSRVSSGGEFLTLSWKGRYISSVSSCEKRGASCRTPNSFLVCVDFFGFREPIKWAVRIEWPKHFQQHGWFAILANAGLLHVATVLIYREVEHAAKKYTRRVAS